MSTSELDVLGVPAPIAGTILQRIALVALAAPKRIIAAAAVMMAVCGIFGLPVTKALSTGGFTDPASESVRAADILDAQVQSELRAVADHGDLAQAVSTVRTRRRQPPTYWPC